MLSRRVKQILGIGVIIVVIAGVVFLFTRLNKPVEEPEPMQTTPKFLTEETAAEPVVEDEEFKWLDNTNISVDPILITEDVVLRSEPRDASSEVMKLTKDMQGKRVAISTDLDGNELGWCRVFVNGKAGYLNIMTFDYILPIDNIEIEDDNLPDELAKELEGRQITIVEPEVEEEEAEAPAEEEVEEEQKSIVTPKEEATPTPTPAPSAEEEPKKEETTSPAPTQAPKQETPSSGGITPEGQALLNQIIADGGTIGDVEMTHDESVATGHTGNVWE